MDRRWFLALTGVVIGAVLYFIISGPDIATFAPSYIGLQRSAGTGYNLKHKAKSDYKPIRKPNRTRKKGIQENQAVTKPSPASRIHGVAVTKPSPGSHIQGVAVTNPSPGLGVQEGLAQAKSSQDIEGNHNQQGIKRTMLRRKRQLQRACPPVNNNKLTSKDELFYRWMFVNKDLKLVGCVIPKVGSTYMKRLTSPNHEANPQYNRDERPTMERYTPANRRLVFNRYKSFLMVRHPYDRLWSAYTSKIMQARSGEFENIARDIIETTRDQLSKKDKKCSDDVTFFEFIRYIIYRYKRNMGANPHWETYKTLCHPCQVNYDVIIRLEEFDREVHYLLDVVGVQEEQHERWTFSSSSLDSMIEAACRLNVNIRCHDNDEIVEKNYQYLAVEGLVNLKMDRNEIIPLLKQWVKVGISGTNSCVVTFKKKFAKFSEQDQLEVIKSRKRRARDQAYRQLGSQEFRMLNKIYKEDFEMFGYVPKMIKRRTFKL